MLSQNGLKSDTFENASGELEAPQSEQRELSLGYLKSLWRPPALGAPSDRSEAAPHLASHRPLWWDCSPTRSLLGSDASHRHGGGERGDVAGNSPRDVATSREVRAGRAGLEASAPLPQPGKARGLPRGKRLGRRQFGRLVRERGESKRPSQTFQSHSVSASQRGALENLEAVL